MNMVKNSMDELDLKIKEQAATIEKLKEKMYFGQVALENLLTELEAHTIHEPARILYARAIIDLLNEETMRA